jgi:excisionase family DNA binding protein
MLKLKQAQQRLNCSRSTLKRLLADGQIEVVRIGRRGIRITEAELEAFIRGNTVKGSNRQSDQQ